MISFIGKKLLKLPKISMISIMFKPKTFVAPLYSYSKLVQNIPLVHINCFLQQCFI